MNNAEREQIIATRQENLRAIIRRAKISLDYTYKESELIETRVLQLSRECNHILDVGKSSRAYFQHFKPGQITTLDINQYDDYPDLIDDICDPLHLVDGSYDGIVCLSVIEHVYNPQAAVDTLFRCLKPGGAAFIHVPFVFRYHAPRDLYFQDYFRFTRDGVAYLFREFDELTLYPVRGPLSSALNLQRYWKKRVEKRLGHKVNRWADKIFEKLTHRTATELQTSGYFIWATKASGQAPVRDRSRPEPHYKTFASTKTT